MFSLSPTLPDEIVKEMLTLILFIGDTDFFNMNYISPFYKPDTWSSSSVLAVCKQWMRVSTPLLYETILLRSQFKLKDLPKHFVSIKTLAPRSRGCV
jgi:hypothetical protein